MFVKKNKKMNKLRGTLAWKGKVKKVLNPEQAKKLKSGEVLVTNMTIPAYIQAMKRAPAFVTDEGGITCHAAILAREMKKPCITGTKNATNILQDGDLAEVDADNGIVRKV